MNSYQKILMVFGAVLFLGACGTTYNEQGMACTPSVVSTTLTAKGPSESGATFVRVNPERVRVQEGCPFTIKNPGNHTVTITTTSTTGWPSAGPTDENPINLGNAVGEGEHKFIVEVEGIGTLDPRAYVF